MHRAICVSNIQLLHARSKEPPFSQNVSEVNVPNSNAELNDRSTDNKSVTKRMQQSTKSSFEKQTVFSARQEIPLLSPNPKIHYGLQRNLAPARHNQHFLHAPNIS
jgi:hypothetical protein